MLRYIVLEDRRRSDEAEQVPLRTVWRQIVGREKVIGQDARSRDSIAKLRQFGNPSRYKAQPCKLSITRQSLLLVATGMPIKSHRLVHLPSYILFCPISLKVLMVQIFSDSSFSCR